MERYYTEIKVINRSPGVSSDGVSIFHNATLFYEGKWSMYGIRTANGDEFFFPVNDTALVCRVQRLDKAQRVR